MIQLPNDATAAGYKQSRPFQFVQVFKSKSAGFEGSEGDFLKAGLAYEYAELDRFTRKVL